MRVSLIGVGDKKFYFNELLKINNVELDIHLNNIAISLKNSDSVPVCLADYGVLFDLVKKFKGLNGEKVVGLAPLSDNTFGVSHMKEFIDSKINGKKIFDEIIDTGDWFKQDATHCLFGNVVLVLGLSPGSMGELAHGYYFYNMFNPNSWGNISKNSINKKIVAGKKIPLHTIIYSPFVKNKLQFELEKYIEKFGGKIFYVSNAKELESVLIKIKKDWQNK